MSGIAISLTGFTGVVSVLSRRSERAQSRFERFLMVALLQWSLIAAFAGLLPGILGALDDPPDDIWRVSLGILALLHCGSAIWTGRRILNLDFGAMQRPETIIVICGFPTGLLVLMAQAAAFFDYSLGVRFTYTASVGYFLLLSALSFSFSLVIGFREKNSPSLDNKVNIEVDRDAG